MIHRHEQILEYLASGEERGVEDLVAHLRVSEMTVRRDLTELQKQGRLERTWGGARIAQRQAMDYSFRAKNRLHEEEKRCIGERAATLVAPGSYVFLDTGTTTLQVARALRNVERLHVITCSVPILTELCDAPGISVTILGGRVSAETMEVYGPLTEKNFGLVKADIAFLGVDALAADGDLMTTTMESARVSERIMEISRKRVLVFDSSKCGASAPVKYGSLSSIDVMVSDAAISQRFRKLARQQKIDLIVA